MRTKAVRLGFVVLLVATFVVAASPAQADAYLCGPKTDFSCLNRFGYGSADTATWAEDSYRFSASGFHNCTRFAAFYIAKIHKIPDPKSSFGHAWNWGKTDADGGDRDRKSLKEWGYAVDGTPRVGDVAWWDKNAGKGTLGHVGIVVEVTSSYVVVASDNYKEPMGTDDIQRIDRTGKWPTGFIHLRNAGPMGLSWTRSSDIPITGDWNGDGKTDIGVVRGNVWYLRGVGTVSYGKGINGGDIPITGDWNGDKKTDIGVVRGNVWYLRGVGTVSYGKGINGGDIPIAGDWNHDGRDEPGVVRGATFYLRRPDGTSRTLTFGVGINKGDIPIVGNFDGYLDDDPAILRGNVWHLLYPNTTIAYGNGASAMLPWAKRW